MRGGIDACVHCGFCLQSCPTYLTLEDENDSPRGRVLLMRSALEGTLGIEDPSLETHIDRCLGCRACETACPSGVPYGHLLEATRATMAEHRRLPLVARLILWAFARPTSLTIAMTLSRLLRATRIPALLSKLNGRLGFAMAMLASTEREATPSYEARGDATRGSVAVLLGCVMEGLLGTANRATERVLVVNGFSLVEAPGQRCCGALHAHAGDLRGARELARTNIASFEKTSAEYICVNAAGCGAMMKEYAHLLADDAEFAERAARVSARVRDVSELLAAAGPVPGRTSVDATVTYDAPCHLLHAQRIADPPLAMLRAIPGLRLVPLAGAEHCCGAAGIYNLVEPDTSNAVLAPKLANIKATGASLVATGNPGCLMQIGAGLRRASIDARAVHPVEVLDESYRIAAR
jgi:glycolate oxidase iron-sulfur subunit